MQQSNPKWTHPGGKLRELGAESLTDKHSLQYSYPPARKANLLKILQRKFSIDLAHSRAWQISLLKNFLNLKGLVM